jgi:hypothetical protein
MVKRLDKCNDEGVMKVEGRDGRRLRLVEMCVRFAVGRVSD